MLEEIVVKAAGVNNCTTEEELRRIILKVRPARRQGKTRSEREGNFNGKNSTFL